MTKCPAAAADNSQLLDRFSNLYKVTKQKIIWNNELRTNTTLVTLLLKRPPLRTMTTVQVERTKPVMLSTLHLPTTSHNGKQMKTHIETTKSVFFSQGHQSRRPLLDFQLMVGTNSCLLVYLARKNLQLVDVPVLYVSASDSSGDID